MCLVVDLDPPFRPEACQATDDQQDGRGAAHTGASDAPSGFECIGLLCSIVLFCALGMVLLDTGVAGHRLSIGHLSQSRPGKPSHPQRHVMHQLDLLRGRRRVLDVKQLAVPELD